MALRKLNVLVYTGTGTTSESVRHCLLTLRRLLYPNHVVTPLSESALLTEPWPATCALLVIPGGADLGYCRVLNGPGNRRIAQYVRSGGQFLGFCAGGYYGSGVCEFEVGNRDLEVVGRRELAFFPGICRGGAYAGFTYHSEAGARAVQLAVHADAFASVRSGATQGLHDLKDLQELVPEAASSYYNGGGVFVDAPNYADRVEVLASYPDDLAVDGGADGSRAAVVYCHVGQGGALLTGPHPEFDTSNLREHPEVPHYPSLIDELQRDDQVRGRIRFLQACLLKLGLDVDIGTKTRTGSMSGVGPPLPELTALHLATLYPDEAQEIALSWRDILSRDGNRELIRGEDNEFHVLQPDAGASATAGQQQQPFSTAMLLDLVDRALRYPKLAELIERVAESQKSGQDVQTEDAKIFQGILEAIAEHAEEDEASRALADAEDAAEGESGGLPSAVILDRWKQRRQTFNRLIRAICRAVSVAGVGKVCRLDAEVEHEIWSAVVHARRVPSHLADAIVANRYDEDGRLLLHHSSADKSTAPTKILLYEVAWPTRVAAFDFGVYYRALQHFREKLTASKTSSGGGKNAPNDYTWGDYLMYGKVLTSTNTLLERNPRLTSTLPTGLTLVATTQLAARGRGRNVWLAPDGQLILSTIVHHPLRMSPNEPPNSRPVIFLQYLGALAVVEAIEAYAPGFGRLGVKVKWPNDIYAPLPRSGGGGSDKRDREDYVKIGGVLAHCSYAANGSGDGHYQVIVGIGLNTTNKRPTTSLEALAQAAFGKGVVDDDDDVDRHAPPLFVKERLLAGLLAKYESIYAQFCRDGFEGDLEARYYRHWLHTDQIVTLEAVDGQPRARVLGISNDWGLLRVAEVIPDELRSGSDSDSIAYRPTGRIWKLQSDENSFDYWKGLLRTKT